MQKKKIFILLMIIFLCGIINAQEGSAPAFLPDLVPPASSFSLQKIPGMISLNGSNPIDSGYGILYPLFKGLRNNTASIIVGQSTTISVFDGIMELDIIREGENFIFSGILENSSGNVKMKLSEETGDFSYRQSVIYNTGEEAGNLNIIVYSRIFQGRIDFNNSAFHSPFVLITAYFPPAGDSIKTITFLGGEIYSDENFSGILLYDIRSMATTTDLLSADDIIGEIKSTAMSPWSPNNIDPDGIEDGNQSYYLTFLNNTTGQLFSSTGVADTLDSVAGVNGQSHSGATKPIPWTLLSAGSYSRSIAIEQLLPF